MRNIKKSQYKDVSPTCTSDHMVALPLQEHGDSFSLVYWSSLIKLGSNKSTNTSLDKLDGQLERVTRYNKPNWPLDCIPYQEQAIIKFYDLVSSDMLLTMFYFNSVGSNGRDVA